MKRLLALGVAALVGLGALAVGFGIATRGDSGAYRGSEPPRGIQLVEFALRDYTGELVRSSELRKNVVVLTFLDSQCTESCPIIASQIGRALDLLNAEERGRVVAVAISTDPKEDDPGNVRTFLLRHRVLGKLHYIGGGEAESQLQAVWKRFNILSSLESSEDTLHSAPVRIYDEGVWVATLHAGVDLTPGNLVHDLRVALRAT